MPLLGSGLIHAEAPSSPYIDGAFVVTVDTTNTTPGGTASDAMGIFFSGTYDVTIHWGDDSNTSHSGADTRVDHTYNSSGIYTIQVEDNGSDGFSVTINTNNTRDKLKYLSIEQMGQINIAGFFMRGAANLIAVNATDAPRSLSPFMNNMFNACTSLQTLSIHSWDWTGVEVMNSAFFNLQSLVQSTPVVLKNLSAVSFNACWGNPSNDTANFIPENTDFVTDLRAAFVAMDLSGYTSMLEWIVGNDYSGALDSNCFQSLCSSMPTTYYDQLLIKCDTGGQSNITLGVGSSTYTPGGAAETARTSLIAKGWTITDAGPA